MTGSKLWECGGLLPLMPISRRWPTSSFSVSEVKQTSFVEVNEEGTEAAAITTVNMVGSMAPMNPPKPFEMIVDRPFLFVIADDQTKSILFMGVIYNPAG